MENMLVLETSAERFSGSSPLRCTNLPIWWNGRHASLKQKCPSGHTGSSPVFGTKWFILLEARKLVFHIRKKGALPL